MKTFRKTVADALEIARAHGPAAAFEKTRVAKICPAGEILAAAFSGKMTLNTATCARVLAEKRSPEIALEAKFPRKSLWLLKNHIKGALLAREAFVRAVRAGDLDAAGLHFIELLAIVGENWFTDERFSRA